MKKLSMLGVFIKRSNSCHVRHRLPTHDQRKHSPGMRSLRILVRFADDAVMAFEHMLDTQQVLG